MLEIIIYVATFAVVAALVWHFGQWVVGGKNARADLSRVTWKNQRGRREDRVLRVWKMLDFLNRRRHLGLKIMHGYDEISVYDNRGHQKLRVVIELQRGGGLRTLAEFDSGGTRGYPDDEDGLAMLGQEATDHLTRKSASIA